MSNTKTIQECEVCSNSELKEVLNLGEHPLCDDLKPLGTNERCELYPIKIIFCNTCKTAHQRYQIKKEQLFPSNYHYRASFTNDVIMGMQNLVDSCRTTIGSLQKKLVLDIGCNDGSLLKIFKADGATTIGVEPTDAAEDAKENVDFVYKGYFGNEIAAQIASEHGKPDVITFTNVFAHIDDLNSLIASLKTVIDDKTILIIENHYLGSVLSGNQFDTFYHEHPRTYSVHSFTYIAEKMGMQILNLDFPKRYGGNIRVILGKHSIKSEKQIIDRALSSEVDFQEEFKKMEQFVAEWKTMKGQEISKTVSDVGPIYAKAFPGRAAILIKLLGLDENSIKGVFERDHSQKIAHYVPSTKIPIIKDELILKINPPVLLNLAWHIKDEIHAYLRKIGYQGRIIDII